MIDLALTEHSEQAREALAEYAHEAWVGWMRYMFSKCYTMPLIAIEGCLVIPRESLERWARQMNTPYAELPENEKQSDRAEADKILAIWRAGGKPFYTIEELYRSPSSGEARIDRAYDEQSVKPD